MTVQEMQVSRALGKWAERLNAWEYDIQCKRNKNKPVKPFYPNQYSLELIDARKKLCTGDITANDAMALLHTVEGRTEIRLCMEAGF